MARTKRVKMPNPTVPGRYTTRGWKKSAPEYPPYITEQRQWDGKGWSGREGSNLRPSGPHAGVTHGSTVTCGAELSLGFLRFLQLPA